MKIIPLIFSAYFFILSGCATHEDVLILDDRLAYLEQHYNAIETQNKQISSTMNSLEKKKKETDQGFRSQYANVRVMRDRLQEEIQLLNGKLEELDHLLKKHINSFSEMKTKLEGNVVSNKNRLHQLEQYLGTEPSGKSATGSAAKKGDGTKKTRRSKDELYNHAKESFDKGNYQVSLKGFQNFLAKYPKSKNADNAQFWIGEIHYREKWYEKAILEYQKVIEKYPKGNKVPSALLKQGLAFDKLGEKANAKLVLKELTRKFPKSNEAKIAQKKIKSL